MVAWNGNRELLGSGRNIYLVPETERPKIAFDRIKNESSDVARALIAEAERRKADLLVVGGYSHARLRERLLGEPIRSPDAEVAACRKDTH